MDANMIFARNMDYILEDGGIPMQDLLELAKEKKGISINYTYFSFTRKGAKNISTDMAQKIIEVLRLIKGYKDIHLWMFFVPNYFRENKRTFGLGSTMPSDAFLDVIKQIIVTANRFKLVSLSEDQFNQMLEVSKFIYESEIKKEEVKGEIVRNVVGL